MEPAEYDLMDAAEERMWWYRALHARVIDALLRRPGPPGAVLDAGCGTGYGLFETIAATVVAFGVGFAVIAGLMRYISTRSFLPFVIYRIVLGGVLIALLSLGIISAG